MKRISIILLVILGMHTAQAQDDRYYENNNGGDDVYTYNNYDEQQLDQSASSYQIFYNDLSPYGTWVQTPSYGYVWMPNQPGGGFQPYMTNGHWEYTEFGWTWVSDFDWGWATFHYGRWYMDPAYGWVWVPGSLWAPAWVAWGQYEGYYCWAPLWPGEYASTHYGNRDHHWYFTQQNHIVDHDLSSHIVDNTVVNHDGGNIEQHVIPISHVNTFDRSVFFAGPKLREVEKQAGRPIQRVNVSAAPRPEATRVSNGSLNIYRPAIRPPARQNEPPARVAEPSSPQQRYNNNNPAHQSYEGIATPQREQPIRQQEWTPPRQNAAPVEIQRSQPTYQRAEPVQHPAPDRGFIPAARPSSQPAPQPQIRMEAPAARPAPAPVHIGGPRR